MVKYPNMSKLVHLYYQFIYQNLLNFLEEIIIKIVY